MSHEIIHIPTFVDPRGSLSVVEASKICGFDIKRVYYLHHSNTDLPRGFHAHKQLKQFFICVTGSAEISLKSADGDETIYQLNKPNEGLLLTDCMWREIHNLSKDAVLVVLASEEFDEEDYITNFEDYKKWMSDREKIQTVPYLVLDRMHKSIELEISQAISETIKSNCFISGSILSRFEHNFSNYIGGKYAIGCGNGLDALVLTLKSLDIGEGDEVLVPANSFVASALAVNLVGATPIFVDCTLDTYSIQLEGIEEYITVRTKAIIPVSLYGIPLDVKSIIQIAEKYNLMIIEDAAQAHGASWFAKESLNNSNSPWKASTFSFYPTKNLGAMGDAGAIITNNTVLADKVRTLGNYGSKVKYKHIEKGYNSRLDPIQAAILDVKLKYLDEWTKKRQYLARIYYQELKNLNGIQLPNINTFDSSVWHVFPIRVLNVQRQNLQKHLNDRGIGTNIHYPIPIHKQPAYLEGYKNIQMPNAELIADQELSLPLDPFHSEDEIQFVIKTIKGFFV